MNFKKSEYASESQNFGDKHVAGLAVSKFGGKDVNLLDLVSRRLPHNATATFCS